MNVEEMTEQKLSLVSQLVLAADLTQKAIDELTEKLAEAAKALDQIMTKRLPDAMTDLELSEVKLLDGSKVTVKPEYHCGIPNAKKDEALHWLRENNCGDLIKTLVAVEFGRGEDAAALELAETLRTDYDDRPVELKNSVHASTLKAFVKERFESGNPVPEELFGVFIVNRATIKRPKAD